MFGPGSSRRGDQPQQIFRDKKGGYQMKGAFERPAK